MRTLMLCLVMLSGCRTTDSAQLSEAAAPTASELRMVELATIHPTQFAVGQMEVDAKQAKYRKLPSDEARAESLRGDPGLAVIGPRGEIYLVDHHHLFKALLQEGVKAAPVKIVEDLAAFGLGEFWDHMDEEGLVFPFDENGLGPLPSWQFPKTLGVLKDDPYRTLAGRVTAQGGFTKVSVPFLEFRWAQYFRPRIKIGEGEAGMAAAVVEALAISHKPEAAELPGFIASP